MTDSQSHLPVAVVIPTYNRPAMALEAVLSVLAQEPPVAQCIVVDDGGSTPLPPELEALASAGRIVLLREPNRGVAGARNRGASLVTAEFFSFLDDDDTLIPGSLAALVEILAARPDAVAAAGGGQRHFTRTHRVGEMEYPPIERADFNTLIRGNPFFTGAVVMRTDAFRAINGVEEKIALAEDWDLWIRMSKQGRIALTRIGVVNYRVHSVNMSVSSTIARLAVGLAEHYLREFSPAERAEHGPHLAGYLAATYVSDLLWQLRRAVRQFDVRTASRISAVLLRIGRVTLRFPNGRVALRSALATHFRKT